MTTVDVMLDRLDRFTTSYAADLRLRDSEPVDEDMPAPERRGGRRPFIPSERQGDVEAASAMLQRLVATIGAFDPAKLEAVLRARIDPEIAAPALSRLSNLCVETGKAGRRRWILRAAARRMRLEELARSGGAEEARNLVREAWTLADRHDPFTRALRAALEGKNPPSVLLSAEALSATVAALEFTWPTFDTAPDPSTLRLKVVRNGLRVPLSASSNPLSRILDFSRFLGRSGPRLSALVLYGGSAQVRSDKLLDLRSALFQDRRCSVAYLDFRRPTLARPTRRTIVDEVAAQLLQQQRGADYGRVLKNGDGADETIRAVCSHTPEVVVLCDAYDSAPRTAEVGGHLAAIAQAQPSARWRFILSVSERSRDWGVLTPDRCLNLDAPGAVERFRAGMGAAAQSLIRTSARLQPLGRRRP